MLPNFRELAVDGLEHPGLAAGAEFYVIGIGEEVFRVVNGNGEPINYPKELFEVVDERIPSGWLFREFAEGEYHLEPATVSRPGFFGAWHGSDGDWPAQTEARAVLRDELRRARELADPEDQVILGETLARLKE